MAPKTRRKIVIISWIGNRVSTSRRPGKKQPPIGFGNGEINYIIEFGYRYIRFQWVRLVDINIDSDPLRI